MGAFPQPASSAPMAAAMAPAGAVPSPPSGPAVPTESPDSSGAQSSSERPVAAAVTSPDVRLRTHALVLARLLRTSGTAGARWRAPGFARQVDLVRGHLRPIHSHEALALIYSREHFHVDPVGEVPPPPARLLLRSATDVAYAHRWLELAGLGSLRPWLEIVDLT